jgi:hypothetical protein
MDGDHDSLPEYRHVLVDTVVNDFVDQMVKDIVAGAADVHRRSLSDRIESLKNFDLIGTVTI